MPLSTNFGQEIQEKKSPGTNECMNALMRALISMEQLGKIQDKKLLRINTNWNATFMYKTRENDYEGIGINTTVLEVNFQEKDKRKGIMQK